ncbi:MAG: ABC transporter ATP-binding protein, partial [Erythrobacter sp.]
MRLTARGLSVARRLSDVSVDLEPGSITAICGPNGAGKSSLLEALAGLLHPEGGAVAMDGTALDAMPPRDRAMTIGYLPQAHEIAWDVPVRNLVELGRMPHGDRLVAPVDAALQALDIEHLAERRAQSLSGGETARVLLARVLAGEPR